MTNPDRDAVDQGTSQASTSAEGDSSPSQPVKRKPVIRNEAREAHHASMESVQMVIWRRSPIAR